MKLYLGACAASICWYLIRAPSLCMSDTIAWLHVPLSFEWITRPTAFWSWILHGSHRNMFLTRRERMEGKKWSQNMAQNSEICFRATNTMIVEKRWDPEVRYRSFQEREGCGRYATYLQRCVSRWRVRMIRGLWPQSFPFISVCSIATVRRVLSLVYH